MKPIINLFIFRRDLRITDNSTLNVLHAKYPGIPILPVFIFNPRQVDEKRSAYYNKNCIQFMIECLKDLRSHCSSLCCFHGDDIDVLEKVLRVFTVNTISWNNDFTPYARKRDNDIVQWCKKKTIEYINREDYTLLPMNTIKTANGSTYEMFTPFYNKAIGKLENVHPKLIVQSKIKFYQGPLKGIETVKDIERYYGNDPNIDIYNHGGRHHALDILDKILKKEFKDYDGTRDVPSLDKTTGLSPFLKFGCVSIREVLDCVRRAYGLKHGIIRELLWREFYAHITYQFPHILRAQVDRSNQNGSFKSKYDLITWESIDGNTNTKYWWKCWCQGTTGYPMVDAGMRQMNKTGWMHNRLRMIVAMFLTKDLLIDWREGERYFATKLIDYDPSSNNGGWQWSASTGTDAQPYFRIFSPTLQAQKFDKNCVYIRRWIPELRNVATKDILNWETAHIKYRETCKYPAPIVIHKDRSKIAIDTFQKVK